MNCLWQKFHEEELTVNNGLQDNSTVELTALLGGQQWQVNSPSLWLEINDEEEDLIDSDPETRDSENNGGEDDNEVLHNDQHTDGSQRKKWKLSDQ